MTARSCPNMARPSLANRWHDTPRLSFPRMTSVRFLLPVLLLLAAIAPAHAQSANETRALIQRIEGLERDLNNLQRQMYRGAAPAAADGAAGEQGVPAGVAAAQEVRMSAIEEQLRQFNGRVEELDFQARQMAQRLEKMQQDVDFRLSALERGQGGAALQGGAPAPLTEGTSPATATPPEVADGQALGAPPRPLGQLGAGAPQPALPTAAPAPLDDQGTTVIGGSSPKDQYEQARGRILQKDYAGAAAGLEAFMKANPEDPLAGAAAYWLGESHYAQGQFDAAAAAFLTGLKKYPKSTKAPDSMLKLGMTLAEMGQKKEACAALADIPNRYPSASLAIKQRAQKERQRVGCS